MKRFSTTDVKRLQLRAQLMGQVREKLAITPGTPMAAMKSAQTSGQILGTIKELNARER